MYLYTVFITIVMWFYNGIKNLICEKEDPINSELHLTLLKENDECYDEHQSNFGKYHSDDITLNSKWCRQVSNKGDFVHHHLSQFQ